MEKTEAGRIVDAARSWENGGSQEASDLSEALWSQFATSSSGESFVRCWLALQCRMIRGVWGGVVLLGPPGEGRYSPAAVWPEEHRSMKHLTATAQQALSERRGLLLRREPDGRPDGPGREQYEIAYPLEVEDRLHGVVVLEVAPRPQPELQAVLRQLYWGTAWLEVLFRRQETTRAASVRDRLRTVLDLLATALEHDRFYEAATAFVTALATKLDCDRVSVGFLKGAHVRVRGMSHSAEFGKETNLVRGIQAAMEEALDQETTIVIPEAAEGPPRVVQAHLELARQQGSGAICSIPLSEAGRLAGVLTLERPAERPFEEADIELCEALAAAVGPLLEGKRREDRWIMTKVVESCRRQIGHLIGQGHVALKLSTLGVVAVIAFFALATGEYRVTAKTVLEPIVRRAVVAPFNGYIATAPVRAGDLVHKGELLASLDDRDLELDRLKWYSQEQQTRREYQRALGEGNASQAVISKAQIAQARAQLDLINDELSRTRLVSPFDGVVVSGDLSQQLGAPVQRGDVLFEVAPLHSYRVILQVDERDIARVTRDQKGFLVVSAFPNDPLPFTVQKVTPVSTAREGRNYFRVEAHLQSTPDRLRPGMEGVGKIDVDRRRLIWIWTHELVDWFRLKLWSWLP